jgi:PIN domain nuclease of toxin-antitoxin system
VILLDTQVLLWFVAGSSQLGPQARDLVREAEGTSHVCRLGNIFLGNRHVDRKTAYRSSVTLTDYARNLIEKNGIRIVPVDTKVAVESEVFRVVCTVTPVIG